MTDATTAPRGRLTHRRPAEIGRRDAGRLLKCGAEVLSVAEAAIQGDFSCGATRIQEELFGPLETQTVHKAQGRLPGTFAKSPHEMSGTDTGNLRQALDCERPRQVGLDVVDNAPQAARCEATARPNGGSLAAVDPRQEGECLHCPAFGEQPVKAVCIARLTA